MTAIRVTLRPCRRSAGTSGSPACPVLDAVPLIASLREAGQERRPPRRSSGRRTTRRAARLWASHRDEIEGGGCTGCVLAATTAAASSAILGCEQRRAKGVDRG